MFQKVKAPYIGKGKRQDNVSRVRTDEFSLPLINCKWGNNGIMFYGRPEDFVSYKNILSVIYNGPPTCGKLYYQENIGVYTDAYLICLKDKPDISRELGLYLVTAIEASTFNTHYARNNKATWDKKVEDDIIFLPVDENGIPDWDYMERYIRAIEKVVIADAVQWKDKVIAVTKETI